MERQLSKSILSRLGRSNSLKIPQSLSQKHRRRSSVNLGRLHIFARKYMREKLTKCPNSIRFLPDKILFARIWGATAPCPPSPTPMRRRKTLKREPDPAHKGRRILPYSASLLARRQTETRTTCQLNGSFPTDCEAFGGAPPRSRPSSRCPG